MITRTLKHRLVRPLIYLVCALMVLAGDPLLALDQNVRIVPKDDQPDWLQTWTDGDTYRDAWDATASWSRDSFGDLEQRLGTWWDGTWEPAWSTLPQSVVQEPAAARAATAFAQQDGDGGDSDGESGGSGEGESLGLTEEELRQLTLTDAVGFEDGESVKTLPLPKIPGQKAGASSFRPPKELIQLMAGKATLDGAPLIPGWNLLSTPEEPADTEPGAVLAPIAGAYTRAYAFENCDTADPWKVYDPADLPNSDLTVLDHTKGFWLEATSAVELPFDGTLPATTDIPICPGWNLIGYPAGQARHVTNALHTIEGKYLRVYGYDATDADDPWEVYSVGVPEWGNDLSLMYPGRGYWVLATEATTLTIANEGPDPIVDLISPTDLDVVTDFTDVIGTVESPILESWRLTYERIGEIGPIELATGVAPITAGTLATFDPTLLINGLYELTLEATDLDGRVVEDSIAVSVEGNMKIGHFTLSFVDLAIPLSGLDIEIVRTYDSRRRNELLDFGHGWSLDIRQGSYQNNRAPGDGWQIVNPGGPFGLPCTKTIETKSHVTTIKLSDQEIYRFRLSLTDAAALIGGCQARAIFEFVDGPQLGSTLEILGNSYVIYENAGDRLLDQDTFRVFEPDNVKLVTRDGRVFHLNLDTGVTFLEDRNGNSVDISLAGIAHSSGVGIDFERDTESKITRIIDPRGAALGYAYSTSGDLRTVTDRDGSETVFGYSTTFAHLVETYQDPRGLAPVRNDYDDDGRLIRHTDAYGKTVDMSHDLDGRREIVTNRLGHSRQLLYDARGNVIQEINELGNMIERTYDDSDRLKSVKNQLGHETTHTHNASGDVLSTIDPLGHTTSYTYNGRGQVLSVTDAFSRVTSFTYDESGNQLTATDPLQQTTQFEFDGSGNLVSMTDALGQATTSKFNGRGDLVETTDPQGHTIEFAYDENGNRLTASHSRTLPDGSSQEVVVAMVYDEVDRVVQVTAADGATTITEYDEIGNVNRQVDPLGRVTSKSFDLNGRLLSAAYPDGTSESLEYDAEGQVVRQLDRLGNATQFVYDAAGQLVRTVHADGTTRLTEYDSVGQIKAETDALGNTTSYEYDSNGQATRVTDALGRSFSYAFDPVGNEIQFTDALGNVTEFDYDALDRLTTTRYPDGTEERTAFDALGRVVAETDQAGRTTTYAYGASGRLASVRDANGQVTSYLYDEIGNRIGQEDASGRVTRFEYDAVGRMTARVLPDSSREALVYYPDGTLVEYTDFGGQTTTFEYDAVQRLARRVLPDGSEHRFTYTKIGQRETVTDSRGVTTYAYDVMGRLLERQDANGHMLGYSYDDQGNLTALQAVVGDQTFTTTYNYDELNRTSSVVDPRGGTTSFGYDANGSRSSLDHANGLMTEYTYDALNRLVGLETTNSVDTLQSFSYSLGAIGNRTQVEESDGTIRSYAYDDLYRLVGDHVVGSDGIQVYNRTYTYDPVGNRLSETTDDESGLRSVSSTYDSRDRLLTAGGQSFGWDANGNLRDRDGDVLTWNSRRHLTAALRGDGTLVETEYDVDGNRVQSRVTSPDGTTEAVDYLVDTRGRLSHVVAEVESGSSFIRAVYFRAEDELLGLWRPAEEEARYSHADGLGSIRLLSDSSGNVTDRYTYTAFGEMTEHAGSDLQPYRFAGEPYDANVGFSYNRARWLDLEHGRFVSEDPELGSVYDPVSLHRYLYAAASPQMYVDPTGRFSVSVGSLTVSLSLSTYLASVAISFFLGKVISAVYLAVTEQSLASFRWFEWWDLLALVPGAFLAKIVKLPVQLVTRNLAGKVVGKEFLRGGHEIVTQTFARIFAPAGGKATLKTATGALIELEKGNAKKGFKHILRRHLTGFWDGSKIPQTTFFPSNTSPGSMMAMLREAALSFKGAGAAGNVAEDILLKNGLLVKLVVRDGKVITFFPISGPGIVKAIDLVKAVP